MSATQKIAHVIVGQTNTSSQVIDLGDLNNARRQHDCFLRLLRELELDVIEVDVGISKFPGNVFIEDAAVVCNGIALITSASNAEEEEKRKVIKTVLEKELKHKVITLKDPEAKLNGSDVLFTGREFFVGISETSNEAGACVLADTFPEYPCTLIKKASNTSHLKKYISIAGPDILCVGSSPEAQDLLKRIEREASFPYQTLTVLEDDAANCLYVNGTLIHRAIEEIPHSFKVFCEKIDFSRRSICFSELAKSSTGLTACCLLVPNL